MADWDVALDTQNDLLAWFSTETGYEAATTAMHFSDSDGYLSTGATEVVGALALAEPIFVSRDITTIIEIGAESFEPEPMYPSDAIVPNGFAYFEQPIPEMVPMPGRPNQPYQAIVWCIGHNEVINAPIAHISTWAYAKHLVGRARGNWASDNQLVPTGTVQMGFGPEHHEEDEAGTIRQIQVLWRLAQQKLFTASPEKVSRAAARRPNNIREIKSINVMRLRRHTPKRPQTESSVDWSCQWLVNGFWRDQWYPSLEAHRQIWIDEYVKGPEDKPFRVKDRVIDFSR